MKFAQFRSGDCVYVWGERGRKLKIPSYGNCIFFSSMHPDIIRSILESTVVVDCALKCFVAETCSHKCIFMSIIFHLEEN